MVEALSLLKTRAQSFLQNKSGAVAFEYVLIIGGVSVAMIFALGVLASPLTSAVMDGTCKSVKELLRHPAPGVHNHKNNVSCP